MKVYVDPAQSEDTTEYTVHYAAHESYILAVHSGCGSHAIDSRRPDTVHEIDYPAVTVSLTEKDRVLDFEDPPYSLAIVQCCSLELDACSVCLMLRRERWCLVHRVSPFHRPIEV